MKRIFVTSLLVYVFALADGQIVADHRIVDHYTEIPQVYLDSVKKMLISIPGESHSGAYRIGPDLLEQLDGTFQVQTYVGTTLPVTDQRLRMGMHRFGGEYLFFSEARVEEIKGDMDAQNSTENPFHVMGFGWCWDMTHDNDPGGVLDPVYQVHWAGRSVEGPDGNMRWGLDKGDSALTGNRVHMDTYLETIDEWDQYCEDNSYPTRWIYTTGPVDRYQLAATENGFQREIKHDYIRDFVAEDTSRILFDYADILCWSNQGEQQMEVWHDGDSLRPHAHIHPENMMDYTSSWAMIPHTEDGDHIGEVGALRLGKALWWMLARMAGWDGNIPLREVEVSSEGDSTWVMTGSYLQFYAAKTPLIATDTTVSWSVIDGSGSASITSTGLLKGGLPGMIEVVATANDGSGVADTLSLIVEDPLIPVSIIDIATAGGVSEVDMGSLLQCTASVLPVDATNAELSWSLLNTTGTATVNQSGLLTALTPGMVELIATAGDGTGVADTLELTISDTVVYITNIDIAAAGGVSELETGLELQISAVVTPVDATYPDVLWSVINGSGTASISALGMLRGGQPGSVKVLGSASDGSGVADTLDMTIMGSVILVSSVEIVSPGGQSEVLTGEDLQLSATVLPIQASDPSVVWSIIPGSGTASINPQGLLTAGLTGDVQVVAMAADASGKGDTLDLTIVDLLIPVTSISITTEGGVTEVEGGTNLQCSASVLPADASNPAVQWSVINGSGTATISEDGLLMPMASGTITVMASALDGSGVSQTLAITITSTSVLVSDIYISSDGGARLIHEGESLQFSVSVLPVDATNKSVSWSVEQSTGTASITQNGLLSALTRGTVLVKAHAQDGSDVSSNFALTIDEVTGSPDQELSGRVVLYPNPTRGKFYLDAGKLDLDKIEIYSLVGARVLTLLPEPGDRILEIDLTEQKAGAYFLRAYSQNETQVHRIILSK